MEGYAYENRIIYFSENVSKISHYKKNEMLDILTVIFDNKYILSL